MFAGVVVFAVARNIPENGVGCNSNSFFHECGDVFNSDVAILPFDDIVHNFKPLLSYSVGQPFNDFLQGIRVLKFVQVAYVLQSVFAAC